MASALYFGAKRRALEQFFSCKKQEKL